MASTATLIQTLINEYTEKGLDKNETRFSTTGALNMYMDDTSRISSGQGIISGVEMANIAAGGYSTNGVKIPVINTDPITISTSDVTICTAVTPEGDTALFTVSYNTLSTDLIIAIDEYDYNYVSLDQAWARALMERVKSIRTSLNGLCIANLDASKNTQQTATNLMGFFVDSTSDEFNVSIAGVDETQMYNYIQNQFFLMDFGGPLQVLGNANHFAGTINPLFAQGTGNSTNQGWQFDGAGMMPLRNTSAFEQMLFYKDSELANGASVLETAFVSPVGSLALVNSTDTYYGSGSRIVGGVAEIGTTSLPGLDPSLQFGFTSKSECVNGRYNIQLSLEARFATIAPYNSLPASTNSAIQKYQVVA